LNGNEDLACEAVQETWLRVIRNAARFKANSTAKTWIYRILMNCCHDVRKRRARFELHNTENLESRGGNAEAQGNPDENGILRAALMKLDRDKRDAVLLCYHAGMTQEQAAEILNVPLGTLKSRVRAGLEKLRQELADGK
jgi:RNA polymerase sigma-70 factor (ECF subfamily)